MRIQPRINSVSFVRTSLASVLFLCAPYLFAVSIGVANANESGAGASKSESQSTQLSTQLNSQIQSSGFKKTDIGIWVAEGDATIFAHQPDKKFIPASTSKIPTAAAVLGLLPQGHKFKTVFATDSKNASVAKNGKVLNGSLKGSLYLIGGGDPSFVSENMWFLVNELMRSGITELDGDLVVDDSRFDDIRFGEDRQSQRVDRAYDAPLGAMSLNWNAVTAWVRPGLKSGDPADVSLDVLSPYIKLENKAKTGAADKGNGVAVERLAAKDPKKGETFLATGTIGTSQPEKAIYKSIREPDISAGHAAAVFLESRGVKIKGSVRSGKAPSDPLVLAAAESKPISQIIADMMKWSNNFVADMLVKNISAEAGDKPATTAKGMRTKETELMRG